jgi:anti-sigma B factor antagonist
MEELTAMSASPPFQVQIARDTTRPVLRLAGELDLAGVPDLEAAFEAVGALPADVILVDLSRLSFLDSEGLKALLKANNQAQLVGRQLVFILGEHFIVRRVFELTRMEHYLRLETGKGVVGVGKTITSVAGH